MGARSSGVVGGTSALHRQLEEGLAALKGTQDCLLCPTGDLAQQQQMVLRSNLTFPHELVVADILTSKVVRTG